MDKGEVIDKLRDYIAVLEDDNTLLTGVRVGSRPSHEVILAGDYGTAIKVSENFDIDFDVEYIKPERIND